MMMCVLHLMNWLFDDGDDAVVVVVDDDDGVKQHIRENLVK